MVLQTALCWFLLKEKPAGDSYSRPQIASWPYLVTLGGHILIHAHNRFRHNPHSLKDLSYARGPACCGKAIAIVAGEEIDGPQILYYRSKTRCDSRPSIYSKPPRRTE